MVRRLRLISISLVAIAAVLAGARVDASMHSSVHVHPATSEAVLWSFSGTPDGANPRARLLVGSGGVLYGTTESGGSFGGGAVFALTPTGSGYTERIIWSFGSSAMDGNNPHAGLIAGPNGVLYGTTYGGGARGAGTVFMLTPSGSGYGENTLLSFCAHRSEHGTLCADGENPDGGLIADANGVLYGTTSYTRCIGSIGGCSGGTVYSLTPDASGWHETVLHRFCPHDKSCRFGDGPFGGLALDASGAIYGATYGGGTGGGTVFKLTPTASAYRETVIHRFCTSESCPDGDGDSPNGDLIVDGDGSIYGTTEGGGFHTDAGVVFRLTPHAGAYRETLLYQFCSTTGCSDGGGPFGGLLAGTHGEIFGTTSSGGSCALLGGCGVVYELVPAKGGYVQSVLYRFCPGGYPCADGETPLAGLAAGPGGVLYGATAVGGAHCTSSSQCGAVFSIAGYPGRRAAAFRAGAVF